MSDKRKEILSSAFFAVLSVLYFCGTFSIRSYNAFGVTVLSSASVPRALAVALLVLSLLHIYSVISMDKKAKNAKNAAKVETSEAKTEEKKVHGVDIEKELAQAEKNENAGKINNKDVVLTVVFLILYVIGLTYLGFIISTFIYIVAQSELMTLKAKRKQGLIKSIILAAVATAAIYFLFNNLLSLLLPVGVFGI
ncbi:MAG: tripartite tricarboxylate transporter TctB family protein [Acidaminococcus sp.]|jgi:hypothetical protein|nr:tripartite tricarboxylate transporter TctB family protein [Acidaminococcus sp.]MCI2100890.1 tripartite tricarboxylate transporter TctB family protein [Acidaminococcus sp.]MCI2117309.1 tripartite tricarboxylate transporter TctB family protein [Acidaminococcus sp.]